MLLGQRGDFSHRFREALQPAREVRPAIQDLRDGIDVPKRGLQLAQVYDDSFKNLGSAKTPTEGHKGLDSGIKRIIRTLAEALEKLGRLPFIRGNSVKLLVDGEETFAEMFATIERAQEYVLAEFFIVNDDKLGQEFKDCLCRAQ